MVKDIGGHKTISILKMYDEVMQPGQTLKEFESLHQPKELKTVEGNALVEAGVDIVWTLACGDTATDYGSSNATIQVYVTDSWVSGVLTASYPTYGSDGKATWKASWTGTSGDGPWSKWAVTNGAQHLNEKTEDLGTKNGGTWTLEVSITIT